MKLVFTALLTLFFFPSLSQVPDYIGYYEQINVGNDAYDASNFQRAVTHFEKAFKSVPIPFTKHLRQFIEINTKAGDYNKAIAYTKQAARLGYIICDSLMNVIRQHKPQDLNAKSLLSISRSSLATKNLPFIKVIDSLYAICLSSRGEGYTAKRFYSDTMNAMILLNATRHYGFPSENRVGYVAAAKSFAIFLEGNFDLINTSLDKLFLDAVYNGEFLADNYAKLYDDRYNRAHKGFYYYQMPIEYGKLTPKEKMVVTSRRNEIGLRSVEKTLAYTVRPDGVFEIRSLD